MKTFQEFSENIKQLRKDLETLERHTAPELRLSARREEAIRKSRNRKPLRQAKSNEKT
jgi:hypothetical protein